MLNAWWSHKNAPWLSHLNILREVLMLSIHSVEKCHESAFMRGLRVCHMPEWARCPHRAPSEEVSRAHCDGRWNRPANTWLRSTNEQWHAKYRQSHHQFDCQTPNKTRQSQKCMNKCEQDFKKDRFFNENEQASRNWKEGWALRTMCVREHRPTMRACMFSIILTSPST